MKGSEIGLGIKISEDGGIDVFKNGKALFSF
jgi:hypothetical protein